MVSRLRAVAGRWAETVGEVRSSEGRRFPEIMAKVLVGRALYDFSPQSFFLADLQNRPFRTWRDHLKDSDDFWSGIHALNWFGEGFALARDKVIASERCAAHGVVAVPIVAVVGRDTARFPTDGSVSVVGDAADLAPLLAAGPASLFAKPAGDQGGGGVVAAEREGSVWHVSGDVLDDRAFAERLLATAPPAGLIVQPRLRNHDELAAVMTGSGLGTVRLLVALTHRGPTILAAALKVLGGDSLADNFHGGATGNLIAAVDVTSGRIVKVYGRAPGRRLLLDAHTTHPVSAARLVGTTLPLWPETRELAERAAAAFPEIPLPGLDIAITPDGPVFIETNTEWSTSIVQLADLRGVRAILRTAWPDLAAPDAVKAEAARHLGL